MTQRIPVIFRTDKDGEVFALFPTEPADVQGLYCTCYAHVGQHSSADYVGCVVRSRPAKQAEYRDLKAELESIGYRIKLAKRRTNAHREAFEQRLSA